MVVGLTYTAAQISEHIFVSNMPLASFFFIKRKGLSPILFLLIFFSKAADLKKNEYEPKSSFSFKDFLMENTTLRRLCP